MRKITRVPLAPEAAGDFLAAAAFLAVVAFPTERKARDEFIKACKAFVIKGAIRRGYPASRIRRKFSGYPERRIWETGPIRRAAARITRRRLPAAAAAIGIMLKQTSKSSWLRVSIKHGGVSLDSVNAAARAFGQEGDTRDTNWITRAWSESRPVLHLALALHSYLQTCKARPDIYDLIACPDWVRAAIDQAERMRRVYLPACGAIDFNPEDAIVLLPG